MKQFEPTQRELNGHVFYIRPFPAFTAANISGEIFNIILPALGSLAPLALQQKSEDLSSFMDMEAEDAAKMLSKGAASINGDKVELMLRKILVKHKNISVEMEGNDKLQVLTEDLANEIFCGGVQDMFILAYDVIRTNYAGFFERIGSLFGDQAQGIQNLMRTPTHKNTAN